jgi:vacuolar-type H+-ATPase subunit E/Vma4
VVLAPGVTLAPLREALIATAHRDAERVRAETAAAVEAELAAAREDAAELVGRARAEARERAELDSRRREAAQRREAQARVLRARREAYESLRDEAAAAVLRLREDPGYEALLDRLEASARERLGPAVSIERDPPGTGGVIARDGQRSIDATLPALAAAALEALGGGVEELWA